ncbi:Hint domain-containing protein [Acidocella sp.]|uniref:Hint domain-containing protein n=1 Tax=Acidocella sp. TaxID=50710 RepID=UPI003D052460
MNEKLNINVPATIAAIGGQPGLSSLVGLPAGLSVSDSDTGASITVQIAAGNSAASLSASADGGASVTANGNLLTIIGSAAQVNAALATLEITEPAGTDADVIGLSALDDTGQTMQSAFALEIAPQISPAFVDPAKLVTLSPNQPQSLPALLLSDPTASALAAMGLGAEETLQLTLSVAAGVLLLPGYSGISGIQAEGVGTGTIELTLNANDIGALNTLLTSLEFSGPSLASGQHLSYALWNHDGVLPREVTDGNIYLNVVGTPASAGTYVMGAQTLVTGATTLSGTLAVSGTLSMLGNLQGSGAVSIAPGALLELPYNSVFLGGLSYDFGALAAEDVSLGGQMLVGGDASLQGELVLAANALMDVTGGLTLDTGAGNDFQEGLSLAGGAVLEGGGTLAVGDFSKSGMIDGSGTILAPQGDTLEIDAGLVASGVNLDVAGGGVMVLGPLEPLYGVFDTTPLTVQSGATLNFQGPGSQPVTGGYANPLGGTGGAFVISGPQVFSGTVTGFTQGDELIFPGLTGLVVHDVNTISGSSSFVVSGVDSNGTTQSYTIFADIPAGLIPAASFDVAGDSDVVLHASLATITNGGVFAASAGVAQPLLGLSLVLAAPTTQSLSLTLSSAHGELNVGSLTPASVLTLTAGDIETLNAKLASLTYTGTGALDVLTITSGTGILAGLSSLIGINRGTTGTVDGYSGLGFTEAELVSFGSIGGLYVDKAPHALGGMLVTGQVEYDDQLLAGGLSGTSLRVDDGGNAVFGGAASVTLSGNATIGDSAGAGALEVLTDHASLAGNLTLTAAGAGSGSSLAVMGTFNVLGTVSAGGNGSAFLFDAGALSATALSLGTQGTLQAYGNASMSLGSIGNAGAMSLMAQAAVTASSYTGTGAITLGGESSFSLTGLAQLNAGQAVIGTDASFTAGSIAQSGGTLAIAGAFEATGEMDLVNASLTGGLVSASLLNVTGMLAGYGVVDAAALSGSGTVVAQGGRMLIAGGGIEATGSLEIESGATLELSSVDLSDTPVSFTGTSSLLVIDNAMAGAPDISGMSSFDAVDLVGIATSLVSIATGTVSLLDLQGSVSGSFALTTASAALPELSVLADGHGGSLIMLGDEVPCFARGTGILTPHGYRPVEALRPGDPVINAAGERRPVRWIGWRTLDFGPGAARAALPVVIRPGAFGPGKPCKTLRLSPLHCIYIQGVLIPVTQLVNGATILRDMTVPAMTYYHLELDRHDALLAEGLACESYFCDGNRAGLYHELGRRSPARRPFAPTVTSGGRLASVRRGLHEQALELGFSTGFVPRLRAVGAGQDVLPRFSRKGRWRFASFSFAEPVRHLTLLCATAVPADTDPDSEDRRELGLCLGDVPGLRLGQGWLPPGLEDEGVWMAGRADLSYSRPRRQIRLPIAAVPRSWLHPAIAHQNPMAGIDARRPTL